jgi:two-component system chemotaxis response regulator CheY
VKVLVVDDSGMMRKLIVKSLAETDGVDIEALEAGDGMQALVVIQDHGSSIDLILCDMNMPKVSGLALLKSLRNSPDLKRIPFVLVTADATGVGAQQALLEGASDVVTKPFRLSRLEGIVHRYSGSGRRRGAKVLFKTDRITRTIRTMTRDRSGFAGKSSLRSSL